MAGGPPLLLRVLSESVQGMVTGGRGMDFGFWGNRHCAVGLRAKEASDLRVIVWCVASLVPLSAR